MTDGGSNNNESRARFTASPERKLLLYTMVIGVLCASTLSFQILSMQGIILSKTAQLTMENQRALHALLDRNEKQFAGSFHSSTYNQTVLNRDVATENTHLLKEILGNVTK